MCSPGASDSGARAKEYGRGLRMPGTLKVQNCPRGAGEPFFIYCDDDFIGVMRQISNASDLSFTEAHPQGFELRDQEPEG